MTGPAEKQYLGLSRAGFHRLAYWEWSGEKAASSTLVAVHGLTRNGRDFDAVAANLAADRRVVCPDVVGRGRSEWLTDPSLYGYPQYLADANTLIARLDVPELDWLGTSMGGMMGMMLAAQKASPIRRLILNDIGPFVPKSAMERIVAYVGAEPAFASIDEVEAHLRRIHAPFGPLTEAQWTHLTRYAARPLPEGGFGLQCDPGIGTALRAVPVGDANLWAVWDLVRCPVLVLRGKQSDLLTADIAAEMVRRKPTTTIVEFPEAGHAPGLMAENQISVIRDWLEKTPPLNKA